MRKQGLRLTPAFSTIFDIGVAKIFNLLNASEKSRINFPV